MARSSGRGTETQPKITEAPLRANPGSAHPLRGDAADKTSQAPHPPSLSFFPLPPSRELGLTAVLRRKSSFSSRASDGDGGRGSRSGDCGRGGPAAPGGGSAPPAARPLQPPAPHRDRLLLPPPLPRVGITPGSGPQFRGPTSSPTSSVFQLCPPATRRVFLCFRTRVPSSHLSHRDALHLFRGCGLKSVPGSRIFGSPPALNAGFQAARPSPALRERNHLRLPPPPSARLGSEIKPVSPPLPHPKAPSDAYWDLSPKALPAVQTRSSARWQVLRVVANTGRASAKALLHLILYSEDGESFPCLTLAPKLEVF